MVEIELIIRQLFQVYNLLMAYIMKNTWETIILITEKEDFQSNLYTNVCMGNIKSQNSTWKCSWQEKIYISAAFFCY